MFFVAFPFLKNKNNTQNINTSYVSSVWIYTSCLQAFLMCFGLALGVKSCKHRSVLRFFLTVFWLYSDCILIVFTPKTWFYSTPVVSHCTGGQWYIYHTFWWSHACTITLHTSMPHTFSPVSSIDHTRKWCRCIAFSLARFQNF